GAYNGKKNAAREEIQKAYEKKKPSAAELEQKKGAIEEKRASGKKTAEEKKNAQLEGIEEEVNDRLNDGVKATEKQISKLEKQIQASDGDTSKLQGKVDKLRKSISDEGLAEMREGIRDEIEGEYDEEYQSELEQINKECDRELKELMDPTAKVVEKATQEIEDERVAAQQFLQSQYGKHIGRPLQGSSNPQEVIDKAKEGLQAEKEKHSPGSIEERICTRLLESLDKVEVNIDLSSVSNSYDRNAIETNLVQLLGKTPEDHVEARGALLKAMGKVRCEVTGYVSQKQVDAMLDRLSQDPALKDFPVGKILKKNLEPFVSSTQVMAANGGKELVMKKMKELSGPPRADRPGFAFKLGAENHREILAGKLNDRIGFNRYLVPKHEVSIRRAKLGETSSPSGIASEWLASGKPLPRETLNNYYRLRKEVAAKQAKGEDVSTEMAELTALRQQLVSVQGGKRDEGVLHQALMNITLQSFDSHIGQFLQVDGQTFGFDEARLLAPSLAYQEESGTFVTFRSALIGHPACQEAMPQEMIDHLRSLDIDGI
ncbi:MAG: hypothetical protein KDK65_07170, partial [Chlamydiia bacterium]|nr:hypothetical protein [Chlamydiia bacterium]